MWILSYTFKPNAKDQINQFGVKANTKIEHFKLNFGVAINSNALYYDYERLLPVWLISAKLISKYNSITKKHRTLQTEEYKRRRTKSEIGRESDQIYDFAIFYWWWLPFLQSDWWWLPSLQSVRIEDSNDIPSSNLNKN